MNSEEMKMPTRKRGRKRGLWLAAGLAVLLLGLAAFFIHESPAGEKFSWQDPSRLDQRRAPGPLTRLRRQLESLPGIVSLVVRYRQQQPRILMDTAIWAVPASALGDAALGLPKATNNDGMRVWILTPAELSSFYPRLKSTHGAAPLAMPKLWIMNDTQGRAQAGQWVKAAGSNFFGGVTIDVTAKVVFSSVKMSVGMTSTRVLPAVGDGLPTVKTNLAAGCQAILPNNGGLILGGGGAKDDAGKDYWVVISPSAVDEHGKPIGQKK